MKLFLTYAPLIIVLCGFIYYTIIRMKKFGVIFTLLNYFKWFLGVSITFFAFYTIQISGIFFKENGISIIFSLPVGILVWFVPMYYSSKLFQKLEDKYKLKI